MDQPLLRLGCSRPGPWPSLVAAIHLYFSSWRPVSSADQYAFSVDVRPRTRTGLGEATVPEFLFSLRRRRRPDRNSGESHSVVMGPRTLGHTDDRSLRSDFRNSNGQRHPVSRPAHLAFPLAGDDSNAALRGRDGRDRILLHDWGRW